MKKPVTRTVLVLAGGAKTVAVVVALAGTLTFAAAPVLAANPHVIGKVTSTLDSDNNLQVCWKEVKLEGNQPVGYEARANVSATYRCVNPIDQCADAFPPTTVSGVVTAVGTIVSTKNGQVAGCLTIEAPPPPEFHCPGAWTFPLTAITYSDIGIEDLTTPLGPVAATPSTLSAVVFECPLVQ